MSAEDNCSIFAQAPFRSRHGEERISTSSARDDIDLALPLDDSVCMWVEVPVVDKPPTFTASLVRARGQDAHALDDSPARTNRTWSFACERTAVSPLERRACSSAALTPADPQRSCGDALTECRCRTRSNRVSCRHRCTSLRRRCTRSGATSRTDSASSNDNRRDLPGHRSDTRTSCPHRTRHTATAKCNWRCTGPPRTPVERTMCSERSGTSSRRRWRNPCRSCTSFRRIAAESPCTRDSRRRT